MLVHHRVELQHKESRSRRIFLQCRSLEVRGQPLIVPRCALTSSTRLASAACGHRQGHASPCLARSRARKGCNRHRSHPPIPKSATPHFHARAQTRLDSIDATQKPLQSTVSSLNQSKPSIAPPPSKLLLPWTKKSHIHPTLHWIAPARVICHSSTPTPFSCTRLSSETSLYSSGEEQNHPLKS